MDFSECCSLNDYFILKFKTWYKHYNLTKYRFYRKIQEIKFCCYKLNVMSLQKFICWNLIPIVLAFGGEALRRLIRLWGQSPRKWDECPYKRDPKELLCPFCLVGTQEEDDHLWNRKQVLTRQWIYPCLGLRLPSLQNCKKYTSVV